MTQYRIERKTWSGNSLSYEWIPVMHKNWLNDSIRVFSSESEARRIIAQERLGSRPDFIRIVKHVEHRNNYAPRGE